jgi:NAD(P)-dependent dehydrogenase (short-subunit alcohol dehydrogenase family)
LHRLASAGGGREGSDGGGIHCRPVAQASVRRLAAEVLARYPKLDVLVNNAGAMYGTRQLTEDGIELTWAVKPPGAVSAQQAPPRPAEAVASRLNLAEPCEKIRARQEWAQVRTMMRRATAARSGRTTVGKLFDINIGAQSNGGEFILLRVPELLRAR